MNSRTGRALLPSLALAALLTVTGCVTPGPVVRPNPEQDALIRQGLDLYNGGQTERGLSVLEAAVNAAETPTEQDIALAILTSHQGREAMQAGRFDHAIRLFERSLDHQRSLGDREAQAKTLTTIANLYSYTGDYHAALDLYREALVLEERGGYREQQARTWLSMAAVTLRLRDYGAGLEQTGRAIELAGQLGDRALLADARIVAGALYRDQGDYDAALDLYQRALAGNLAAGRNAEAGQARITIGELYAAKGDLDRAEAVLETELAHLVSRRRSTPETDSTRFARLQQQLDAARAEFEQLMQQILREDADVYSLLAVKPESLLGIARQLPADVLLVSYFVTERRLYIFFVEHAALQARTVPVSKEQLNRLVQETRDYTLRNYAVDPGDWSESGTVGYLAYVRPYKERLTELYRHLIEPLQPALDRHERIAVIPFGVLHYLPLHALAQEDGAGRFRFVVDDHQVVYLLPTTLADQPAGAATGTEMVISAFGNPDLGDPDLDLPSAREEVQRIASLFPSTAVFTGADATKRNFVSRWDESSLIHLAAHGDLDPVKGPALLLAPAGPGRLALEDITALPQRHRRPVVTLSACETALAADDRNPTGSEISSVAYAFSRAGAGGVIATLWVIEDTTTAHLMNELYLQVAASGGLSYPLLRTAQLQLLHGEGLQRQPFYWAPFIYYGLY